MDFLEISSPYHILAMSIFFYLVAYFRRVNQGDRDMKINPWLEKILFPFSKKGKAALISIIIVVYMELSLLVSYMAIGILKVSISKVNIIWDTGTFSMLFFGTGISIFHEMPASREGKVLKAITYVIAVGCIGFGCKILLTLIKALHTNFSNIL